MPKTKFQSFIFTIIMVFCMVFCMTSYTIAIKMHGLSYQVFALAIREMWIEYVIVFCLIFFFITKNAQRLTFRILSPEQVPPIFIIISIQTFTVAQIVPSITLIVTFLHNGFTVDWFCQWIQTAVMCFPMAFFLQIIAVGPFVRMFFRNIFKKQLQQN